MKSTLTTRFASTLSVLLLMVISVAEAQPGRNQQSQRYFRNFDTNTVETVEGNIVEITKEQGRRAGMAGIHLLLEADTSTVAVHLGPAWYIEQQDSTLERGEHVSITGSRIMFEGKETIIASVIQRDGAEFVLRDEQGIPRWNAWRGRKMP